MTYLPHSVASTTLPPRDLLRTGKLLFLHQLLRRHRIPLLVVATAMAFLHPAGSYAQHLSVEDVGSQVGLHGNDLPEALRALIQWFLGFLAIAAVAFIVYGGFIWMTAAGSEERLAKAKKIIEAAIIGLIIVHLAWAIVVFVIGTASTVIT